MRNSYFYTPTPKPPKSLIEFVFSGCHIELFFAWYDCWIGVFYNRKKKTIYIGLLPMLIFAIRKIRPDPVNLEIKVKQQIIFNEPSNLENLIRNNPELHKKIIEDMRKHIENESRKRFFVGWDNGDPNGDNTVFGETDGKTFREIRKEK